MHAIGTVIRLQIQRSSLKVGEKPNRHYDPSPILALDRLWLTPDGSLGQTPGGAWVVDVHHRAHPQTKNDDGLHGVSVGFDTHYARMQQRFGERITFGCAGENLLVRAERTFAFEDLKGGLILVDAAGREVLALTVLEVAHPCRPFTGWALGTAVEPEELKAHLQFLDGGTRGFYCTAEGRGLVTLGDQLVLRNAP